MFEGGERPETVIRALGFPRTRIYNWLDQYREGGIEEASKFVKGTKDKLRLSFLPPYSPELNPDERIWNYLKNHKIGRQTTKNGWDLLQRVGKIMRSLQRIPLKVKSFF